MGSTRSATGDVRRLSESAAAVAFVEGVCLFAMGVFGERERFLVALHGGTGDSSSELSPDMELAGREQSLIIRIEPNTLHNKNQLEFVFPIAYVCVSIDACFFIRPAVTMRRILAGMQK